MAIRDFLQEGLDGDWRVTDASKLEKNQTIEADVVIVGTGAGGATAAEQLVRAGLDVVLVEEGRFRTTKDFRMDEMPAFRWQYQEAGLRRTAAGDINLLQGRMVGGSTAVSWGTIYDPPAETLQHWQEYRGVNGLTPEALAPSLKRARKKLGASTWKTQMNGNNAVLRDGCNHLGWHWKRTDRAVRGCWNLGYCTMGCPTNALQSTLVSSVPAALNKQARLFTRLRCERLAYSGSRVKLLHCRALQADGVQFTNVEVSIRARHFILAAGGIGSPGILLRSSVPDPHRRIGRRTFLHPIVLSRATFEQQINPFHGAPQATYSDHYLFSRGIEGPMGFRIEPIPLHPLMWSATLPGHGARHARWMSELPNTNCLAASLRDGFVDASQGGSVELDETSHAHLTYPLTDYVWEGVREAWLVMAEIQFAAGAQTVMPVHADARPYARYSQARAAISELAPDAPRTRFASAQVMGGCSMGNNPQLSVVNSSCRHHHLSNLSVFDGSVFPTSLGAAPQLTITALARHFSENLVRELTRTTS